MNEQDNGDSYKFSRGFDALDTKLITTVKHVLLIITFAIFLRDAHGVTVIVV